MGSSLQIGLLACCLECGGLEESYLPGFEGKLLLRQPMGDLSSLRTLLVDEDGLFISGPAIVEILHDNRPICRRFDFSLMEGGVLLPQPEMAENAFDELRLIDKADKLHFITTSGTAERVYFPG
jgi:hypothetical protein